jgi:hypothetical protein
VGVFGGRRRNVERSRLPTPDRLHPTPGRRREPFLTLEWRPHPDEPGVPSTNVHSLLTVYRARPKPARTKNSRKRPPQYQRTIGGDGDGC